MIDDEFEVCFKLLLSVVLPERRSEGTLVVACSGDGGGPVDTASMPSLIAALAPLSNKG
jgi:hypothetical protein